jgi:EAL domain-containing protein (putative c-di-GMP-specific phosphodiesterase class I)
VVAEGVETPEQLAWVRAQGIEFCQGYLFARPLPVAEFEALLAAR